MGALLRPPEEFGLAAGHAGSSHETHQGGAHVHVHHLSPSPIILGVGALVAYIGMGLGALASLSTFTVDAALGVFGLGVLVFLVGIGIWLREDSKLWREHSVDHGVSPGRDLGWWGMIFFLGTEIILFGGLFASFFVARDDVPLVWERAREHLKQAIPLVTINTLILMSSGGTMHYALHAIRKDDRRGFKIGLVLTLLLGATFLVIQMREYGSLIAAGVVISGDNFGSIFYLLTGTHAFHVFLGLVFIGIVAVRGFRGQFDSQRHVAVDAFAIYWHFVDVVWVLLYVIVYLGVI